MKYEFLEQREPSLLTRVSVVVSAIIVGVYSIYSNPFYLKTLVLLLILSVLVGSMFIFSELIVVDTDLRILGKMRRLWRFDFFQTETAVELDDVLDIFINKAHYSQSIRGARSFHSLTTHKIEYSGFLKLRDEKTFYLGSAIDKGFLLYQLNNLASVIRVDIRDNTR